MFTPRTFLIVAAVCAASGCSVRNDTPGFAYPDNVARVEGQKIPRLGPTANLVTPETDDADPYETTLHRLNARAYALRKKAAKLSATEVQ